MKIGLVKWIVLMLFAFRVPADDGAPEVTIEIFSDFQCPYCKQFAPAARGIESQGVEGIKTKGKPDQGFGEEIGQN